jgi:hypothetical protein
MKKFFHYFIAGFAAVAVLSCAKEVAPQDDTLPAGDNPGIVDSNKVPMVFSAVTEDTKSNIDGSFILWEDTDKIAIFDGSSLNEFSASSVSSDGKSAEFSGSAATASTYHAIAPYAKAGPINTENQCISVTVSTSQTIKAGHCVDSDALLSTAVSDNTNQLTFTNQFSLVKVTLTRSDIATVRLEGNNNESVAGTNHYYYGGEGAPRMDLSNAGQKSVTIHYEDAGGSQAAFPAGDYYLVIWPTEFTEGYHFILSTTDGSKTLLNTSTAATYDRNGGHTLGNIDEGTFCPSTIMTAAQLKMWRRLASAGAYVEGDEVKLGADINLGGYAWAPVSEFLGVFDGQNHKIYNFTISSDAANVGFIGTLGSSNAEEAVLKDVVFGSSNGTSYDGTSTIEITGARSGWTYGGIIGYAHKKTTISGVTSFMPVSAASSVTGKHAIGGIAGSGNGGSGNGITITGCHNYGTVSDNSTHETVTSKNLSAIGGILGATDGSYTTVSNCANHAEVHNYCVGVSRIGGIVGKAWDARCTIDGCSNEGDIINEAASITDATSNWDNCVGVGGILGAFTASDGNLLVNKCTNSGKVYFKTATNSSYRQAYGGIAGSITYGGSIKGCTNTGKIYDDAVCSSNLAMGGILGCCNTAKLTITKAADDTPNTNSGEIFHYKSHTGETWMGGIVGLENSGTTPVEYSINNGRIVSDPSGQGEANAYLGGICGASKGVIRYCTNNGYIFTWAGKLTVYIGGICGGNSSSVVPSKVLNCTNNGWLGPYNTKGSSSTGGILARFYPSSTEVRECMNTGLITTGDFYSGGSGNTPNPSVSSYQKKDYFMGGLFGKVEAPTGNVTDNVTDCVVACTISNKTTGSYDDYTGLIAGECFSTSSTSYQLVVGTAASPVMIVNTCSIEYSDASGSNETINTTAKANKWLMGSHSSLYDATNGTSDTSKLDFNYTIATAAQAGIE